MASRKLLLKGENGKLSKRRAIAAILIIATLIAVIVALVMNNINSSSKNEPTEIANVDKTVKEEGAGDDENSADEANKTESGSAKAYKPQPEADLNELNKEMIKCLNMATDPSDQDQIRAVTRNCFYSMPVFIDQVYGLKTVLSGTITDETVTEWIDDREVQAAKDSGYTVTHVYIDGKHAADIECMWDVFLKSCKPADFKWTQIGKDLHNRSIVQHVNTLK